MTGKQNCGMSENPDIGDEIDEPDQPRRLRGKAWVQACLAALGTNKLSVLDTRLNVLNSPGLWGMYQSGKRRPMPGTVTVVGQKLPGTAEVWLSPIWDVLNDDAAACESHVDRLLERFTKSEPWMLLHHKAISTMTLHDKCQALLEIVIPRRYLKFPDLDEDLLRELDHDFENRPFHYRQFSEICDHQANIIAQSYREAKATSKIIDESVAEVREMWARLKGEKYEQKPSNSNNRAGLLNKDYVCGVAALVCLCNESKDRRLRNAPAYLKQGIVEAVKDNYGVEVADYFMTSL